ncbi:MAG: DUF4954 family protein [Sphaerochaetaceae bacterium]|nr:DUF4954 family protein [Sphaerochaetaceae bacterium]
MSESVTIVEKGLTGFGFIEGDEYKFRNKVSGDDSVYRHLTEQEISVLEKNDNIADDWNNVLVKDEFDPSCIRRAAFYGKVRIGRVKPCALHYHDLELPCGIYYSTIISSDIGDCCSIRGVSFMSHYIVHDKCILFHIRELQTTNHSKFGNCILKDGEDPSVLVSLSVMNENEGRAIAAFEDLTCADAFLWADNPADKDLNKALWALTKSSYSSERGWYGEVGEGCVIKDTGIIKDVMIGPSCYIKGANKIKNITIKSTKESPVQLGEGIELVNGIIGPGCKIFYGCKAIRFVMCENSQLKYGARLINSVLGDNSTVSCCEVLSNLLFPFHEQHHNNSFLISALIMGQSNMAAGANIGSNHNSRAADGEMRAGRGFWPALSSSIKYNSRFASFVMISKGQYIHELNIRFPFTLLSDNLKHGYRQIYPAFLWINNMYALERNCGKFADRDKRKQAVQHIETDYLAPDTAAEILDAFFTLRDLYEEADHDENKVQITDMENSKTPVRVLRCEKALQAYSDMIEYYCAKEIVSYCSKNGVSVSSLDAKSSKACKEWENLGGQLVPSYKVEDLKNRIKKGEFKNWKELHKVYDKWFEEYPLEKALNAITSYKSLTGCSSISEKRWNDLKKKLSKTRSFIDDQVYATRAKDYSRDFRLWTYKSYDELESVMGPLEDNSFIKESKKKTAAMLEQMKKVVY